MTATGRVPAVSCCCSAPAVRHWTAFFAAIARVDYTGPITFESFSPAVLGDEFANLVALWRDPWSDPDEIARDAIAFLRHQVAVSAIPVGV
jgi:D-psicose/D-tagatose/L-ribulose 3-epimerase